MHNTWCSSYNFIAGPMGSKGSTCKLFDDCTAAAKQGAEQTQLETARLSALYEKSMARGEASAAAQLVPSALANSIKAEITAAHPNCLRLTDSNFDSWFAHRAPPMNRAYEADCDHACFNAGSAHKAWCAAYEFEAGACKLYAAPGAAATAAYAACPKASARQEAQAAAAASVAAAQEAAVRSTSVVPANAKRCLRIADADFDSWFLVKTPSRKGTEADCDHACNNVTSAHLSPYPNPESYPSPEPEPEPVR